MSKYVTRSLAVLILVLIMAYAAWCVSLTSEKSIRMGPIKITVPYNKMFFYQKGFFPAIGQACGYGVNYIDRLSTKDFLDQKVSSFDCKEFKPTYFKSTSLLGIYLFKSVGIWWHIFGISWRSASYFFWFVYCLTVVLLFTIYRFVSNDLLAAIATVVTSNIYLYQLLIGPRDFLVAFFFCIVVLLSLILVCKKCSWKKLYLIAIIAGLFCGVGIGIRSDVMALALLFVFSICFSNVKTKCFLGRLKLVIPASIVFVSITYVLTIPLPHGDTLFHVVIEGLATRYTGKLGLSTGYLYSIIPRYSDEYIHYLINKFALTYLHVSSTRPSDYHYSYDYYLQTKAYYFYYLSLFQADTLIRMIGSVILTLSGMIFKYGFYSASIVRFGISLIAIFSLLARNLRVGMAALFFTLGSCSYMILQFHVRHSFYLSSFFPLFYFMVLVTAVYHFFVGSKYSNGGVKKYVSSTFPDIKKAGVVVAIIVVLSFLSLFSLRTYQNEKIHNLISSVFLSKKNNQPYIATKIEGGWLLQLKKKARDEGAYYVVTFSAGNKKNIHIQLASLYSKPGMGMVKRIDWSGSSRYFAKTIMRRYASNFTTIITAISNHKKTIFLVPTTPINTDISEWKGFVIPTDEIQYLDSIQSIDDLSQFPIQPFMVVPSNWGEKKYYQFFRSIWHWW